MVGTVHESSKSSDQASVSRQKQASAVETVSDSGKASAVEMVSDSGKASAVETVSDSGKKPRPQSDRRSMLQECVAGEMAQPEAGVSSTERRMWGEIFQSRQNFVDMHCC